MGQVEPSLGLSNCLLGQLYCKRTASIAEIADHYEKSHNRFYFKSHNNDEDCGWSRIGILFELFIIYHYDEDFLRICTESAKPTPNHNQFNQELRKSELEPIIIPASFPSKAHELIWAELQSTNGRDMWDEKEYQIFDSIPLCFAPGWRMKINLIPRVRGWRPDEWWLSNKHGDSL